MRWTRISVMETSEQCAALAQGYGDRADAEKMFDVVENQWGGSG